MKLGDFSATLKEISIRPGSVFRMTLYPEDGVTPKNEGDVSRTKYFVVIGIDKDSILVGSLLINSEINSNLNSIIAPYQHRISNTSYGFIGNKDRYIDCYRIKELSYGKITDSGEYIGLISEGDLEKAIELAIASPVNKPRTLLKFGVLK